MILKSKTLWVAIIGLVGVIAGIVFTKQNRRANQAATYSCVASLQREVGSAKPDLLRPHVPLSELRLEQRIQLWKTIGATDCGQKNSNGEPLDAWGRPLRVLSGSSPDNLSIILIRSDGPDGRPTTDDDIDVIRKF